MYELRETEIISILGTDYLSCICPNLSECFVLHVLQHYTSLSFNFDLMSLLKMKRAIGAHNVKHGIYEDFILPGQTRIREYRIITRLTLNIHDM